MRWISGFALILALIVATGSSAWADEPLVLGGDVYVSGSSATVSQPSPRDALAVGFSVNLRGRVESDGHAMGFNVDVEGPVGGNLYASGFSVTIEQPVGEDVTAGGFNVHLRKLAAVGGNARLAGGNVTVDAPVAGSLLAAAGTLAVNGTIAGDARLTAGTLVFGPEARIGGTLTYASRVPVEIPASVIAADRVRFEKLEVGSAVDSVQDTMGRSMPHFWPSFLGLFFGFVVTILFLVVTAAVLLSLAPRRVEELRSAAIAAPFRSIGLGVLGLATLVGLIPVSAMTLIGIPLIPVVLLAIVALWIVGYLLGVYALAWRIAVGLRQLEPTLAVRLAVIAVGLAVAATLNFIPFIGWLINLTLIFLGLGTIAAWIFRWLAGERAADGSSGIVRPEDASPDAVI
ncbi:MAG: hypothetical protein Q8Q62_05795 [Mesorhizobium sp.]|nr:hypothetical protein [Mesorhizobium sp.]